MRRISETKLINLFIYIAIFSFLFNKTCYLPMIFDYIVSAISMGLFLFLLVWYIVRFKYSKIIIIFGLYFIFGLLSCYLGEYSNPLTFFKIYYPIFGALLLIDIFIKSKCKLIIFALEKAFFTLIFINFLTIIFYPNGLFADELYSNNWFLLYDNLHIFIYIPGLIVSLIASKYKKNKYLFFTMLSMIMYSVFFCKSATSMVGLGIFLILYLFKDFFKKFNFMNAVTYLYTYITIFIGIVVLRFQNLFSFFIVDYLHKDLTFTGRTFLWDNVLNYIQEKPFLGYGIESNSVFINKMGFRLYTHAHNTIYDIVYKGGIVSLIFFAFLLIISSKKLKEMNKSVISVIISGGMLSLYLMMNFEAREDKIGLYLLIILSYYISNIIKDNNTKENECDIDGQS